MSCVVGCGRGWRVRVVGKKKKKIIIIIKKKKKKEKKRRKWNYSFKITVKIRVMSMKYFKSTSPLPHPHGHLAVRRIHRTNDDLHPSPLAPLFPENGWTCYRKLQCISWGCSYRATRMFTVSDLLIKGTFSLALTSVVNVLSPAFQSRP